MGGSNGELAGAALRFKKIHSFYIRVWFACALVVVIMATWMSYIGASPDKFDDYESTWQACLFEPNYFYTPVGTKAKLGMFINSLVFVGMIGISMTLLGNCAMYWAWSDTRFSVPAAFFGLWCSLVGFTYYTPSPPLPVPSETNATLLIFMYWIKKDYYSDLSSECTQTYNFVVGYLSVCFIMLCLMGMGTNITFYYLYQKYKAMDISILSELRNASSIYPTLIFANTLAMMTMYIGAFLGKVVSSVTAVDAYAAGEHAATLGQAVYPEIFFPFKPAYMSVSSMCWAAIFVGVLYGLTNRSDNVRSFKLAAAASLLYSLVSYPSMVYIIQLYYQMNLDSDTECTNYFNSDENAAIYGYPSSDQSATYCYSFRVTTFMGVVLFIQMHFQAFCCYRLAVFNSVADGSRLKDRLLDEDTGLGMPDNESSFLFPRSGSHPFKEGDGGGKVNIL